MNSKIYSFFLLQSLFLIGCGGEGNEENNAIPTSSGNHDSAWISQYGFNICRAGVTYRNRWGDDGQAQEGTYVDYMNGEHVFKEYEGISKIRCLIAGDRLHMGWHTRAFNVSKIENVYYSFEKNDKGVRVFEHAYGQTEYRDYVFE